MSGMTALGGCRLPDVEYDSLFSFSPPVVSEDPSEKTSSRLTAPIQENTLLKIDVPVPGACLPCLLASVDINQVVINKMIQ